MTPIPEHPCTARESANNTRVGEQHTNSWGGVHGGVLTTLADVALGYARWPLTASSWPR